VIDGKLSVDGIIVAKLMGIQITVVGTGHTNANK